MHRQEYALLMNWASHALVALATLACILLALAWVFAARSEHGVQKVVIIGDRHFANSVETLKERLGKIAKMGNRCQGCLGCWSHAPGHGRLYRIVRNRSGRRPSGQSRLRYVAGQADGGVTAHRSGHHASFLSYCSVRSWWCP